MTSSMNKSRFSVVPCIRASLTVYFSLLILVNVRFTVGKVDSLTLRHANAICQATCITGEFRTLDQKKVDSWRNLDLTGGRCYHIVVVGSKTTLGSPKYVKQSYDQRELKDQKIHKLHRLRTDFARTQLPDLSNRSHVGGSLTFILSQGNQRQKYMECMEFQEQTSRRIKKDFQIYARSRPDALWYMPLTAHIDLTPGLMIASHADTAWIGHHENTYFSEKIYKRPSHRWWPGFIIKELNESATFRASTNTKFDFLPWVLCRTKDSFATVYNFVNHWLTPGKMVRLNDYGAFCYRLYMLFGEDIIDLHRNTQSYNLPADSRV